MAELDISLIIYSDKEKKNRVANIQLGAGPAFGNNMWKCRFWAEKHGFTVYNPAFYDPRFQEEFKDAGTIVDKSQMVEWLNDGVFSTPDREPIDGTTALSAYPESYIFRLTFVDWS